MPLASHIPDLGCDTFSLFPISSFSTSNQPLFRPTQLPNDLTGARLATSASPDGQRLARHASPGQIWPSLGQPNSGQLWPNLYANPLCHHRLFPSTATLSVHANSKPLSPTLYTSFQKSISRSIASDTNY